jgi:hypothetical protein
MPNAVILYSTVCIGNKSIGDFRCGEDQALTKLASLIIRHLTITPWLYGSLPEFAILEEDLVGIIIGSLHNEP